MPKTKIYRTEIPLPIYGYTIRVVFTDHLYNGFKETMLKDKLDIVWEPGSDTRAFHIKPKGRSFCYIFFNFDATIDEMAHECYHSICGLFKWIGAEHDEELLAYHLGYITNLVAGDHEKAKNSLKNSLKKPLTKADKNVTMDLVEK